MINLTFEEILKIEDDAIFAARRVGAQAYKQAQQSGDAVCCPFGSAESEGPLDDIRLTAWYDGWAQEQARAEGPAFKVLGTPTPVKIEAEHDDGTVTYSIPAPWWRPPVGRPPAKEVSDE